MTDFENCKNDLNKWNIRFSAGFYYNNNNEEVGRYIIIPSSHWAIDFDLDGNYETTH